MKKKSKAEQEGKKEVPKDPEDRAKMWSGRIELSKEYQTKFGNTGGRWDKYVKARAGDFGSESELGPEAIDVNELYATQQTMLPPLWLRDPRVRCKPTKPKGERASGTYDNIANSKNAEAELNYWGRELAFRMVGQRCLLDSEATNIMVAVVGYVKDKSEIENAEGERIENDLRITPKRPFFRRISPKALLVPPGYAELEECPWACILWRKPVSWVKGKWPEQTKNMTAGYVGWDEKQTDAKYSNLKDYLGTEDAKSCEVREIWDKTSKKRIVMVDGVEEILEEGPWPYKMEGFPIVFKQRVIIPDEFYGTPPSGYYYPQNKELNACRTAMRKRFNKSKSTIAAAGEVQDAAVDAYNESDDMGVWKTGLTGDEDIRAKLLPVGSPPPDPNVLVYEDRIKRDILEVSGLGQEQRGAGDPNIDSATASANVEKWGQVRATDLADLMAQFYLLAYKKTWMILKQFPDVKRTRMIAGPSAGQVEILTYTLAEIEGEFDFEMDITGMLAETPQSRVMTAIGNYNLFRADPLVNPQKLVIDVFEAQAMPDPSAYLAVLRNPDEELQMMAQGLPVEANDLDNHEEHIAKHEQQLQGLDVAMQKMAEQGTQDDASQTQIQLAGALLSAHVNSHAQKIQKIAAAQPGKPQDQNLAKKVEAQKGGIETAAEMGGQPMVQ